VAESCRDAAPGLGYHHNNVAMGRKPTWKMMENGT